MAHNYNNILAFCATMCANHGRKKSLKRRPSPLQLHSSRPVISSPVLVHAGQFTEENDNKLGGFTDISLENLGVGEAGPWNRI
jgi:hypothetical protein